MIKSDKIDNVDRQRLEIAIRSAPDEVDSTSPILGFNPNDAPDDINDPQIIAPNFLDNSDFDYSQDGYLNNPLLGGDIGHECYNWFRHRFIKVTDIIVAGAPSPTVNAASGPFKAAYTYPMDFVLLNGKTGGAALSGTLTRVSDTQATLSVNAENNIASGGVLWFGTTVAESAANALKATAHSLFAANEGANDIIPRWEKTNGWVEIGSDTSDTFSLDTPLPVNLVRGGLTFYFKCIVALRPGATTGNPIRISAGVWDSTAAEKRFLESSNLDLSVGPVGTAGSTTYSYVILADLDDGTTIMSDVVTIATGNAVLSASNYNRLVWENATGVLNFRVYRSVGGVVKRVFTIRNGSHDFNDLGSDEGETLGALPSGSLTRPIVYKVSPQFNPTSSTVWIALRMAFEIPATYDTSRTTGKQWLRVCVEGICGDARLIALDRISFSTSDGGWSRSARDLALISNQNPSSLPTDTTQGGTGVFYCFTLDTPVVVCDADGSNQQEVDIGNTDRGMFVFDCNRVRRIENITDSFTDKLIYCRLSNGVEWLSSVSERFITTRSDRRGTRIDELTFGDQIQSWQRWRLKYPVIKQYRFVQTKEPRAIRTLSLKGGKTFLVGRLTGWRVIVERARNQLRRVLSKEPQYTKARAHNYKQGPDDYYLP